MDTTTSLSLVAPLLPRGVSINWLDPGHEVPSHGRVCSTAYLGMSIRERGTGVAEATNETEERMKSVVEVIPNRIIASYVFG